MVEVPQLLDMLKTGMHFGHKTSKWHPKMEPYIFTERNGIHILDLEQTRTALEKAAEFARETVKNGGLILFVGSKRQAQDIVRESAKASGMPFVIKRWLGGTLTNFPVILNLLKKFNSLKEKQASGELDKYTKKEQLDIQREITKLDESVGGMASLVKTPDAIFVVDLKKEETAVSEANKKNIPIIGITDTNSNPELVKYPIPANDDAKKSIEMIVTVMAEAIKEGSDLKVAKAQLDAQKETAKPAAKKTAKAVAKK